MGNAVLTGRYRVNYRRCPQVTYRGAAVATSRAGTSIECEYVTSSSRRNPEGFGVCRDNHGRVYRLIF